LLNIKILKSCYLWLKHVSMQLIVKFDHLSLEPVPLKGQSSPSLQRKCSLLTFLFLFLFGFVFLYFRLGSVLANLRIDKFCAGYFITWYLFPCDLLILNEFVILDKSELFYSIVHIILSFFYKMWKHLEVHKTSIFNSVANPDTNLWNMPTKNPFFPM